MAERKTEGFKQESQNPGITLMYLSYFCTCNEGDLLLYWFFLIVSFTSFVLSTRQVVLVLYPSVSISPFSCLIIVIEHSDINRNSGGKGDALLNRWDLFPHVKCYLIVNPYPLDGQNNQNSNSKYEYSFLKINLWHTT